MRRSIAITWHATFFLVAAALYFFFVLPRWFELTGVWTPTLGLPLRIVTGLLIGLAALPVVFTLLRTRKPEFGTPQLALSLRLWSIVAHAVAGALIVGAAVAEIWLSLDGFGRWLFGVYGAAAALAVLGALGFYLAFLAELPPPPPKPIKLKPQTTRRGRGKSEDEPALDVADEAEAVDETDVTESEISEPAKTPVALDEDAPATAEAQVDDAAEPTSESEEDSEAKLKNRRPGGKSTSRFRRKSGGVALDE